MKKHKKIKHYYMHTMEGRPAHFNSGRGDKQLAYRYCSGNVVVLVKTLKQIRRQQQLSLAFRTKQGWDLPTYGYIRVVVPE